MYCGVELNNLNCPNNYKVRYKKATKLMDECPDGVDLNPSNKSSSPKGAEHTLKSTSSLMCPSICAPHRARKSGLGLAIQFLRISVITPSKNIDKESPKILTWNTCNGSDFVLYFSPYAFKITTSEIIAKGTNAAKSMHATPDTRSSIANGCEIDKSVIRNWR